MRAAGEELPAEFGAAQRAVTTLMPREAAYVTKKINVSLFYAQVHRGVNHCPRLVISVCFSQSQKKVDSKVPLHLSVKVNLAGTKSRYICFYSQVVRLLDLKPHYSLYELGGIEMKEDDWEQEYMQVAHRHWGCAFGVIRYPEHNCFSSLCFSIF